MRVMLSLDLAAATSTASADPAAANRRSASNQDEVERTTATGRVAIARPASDRRLPAICSVPDEGRCAPGARRAAAADQLSGQVTAATFPCPASDRWKWS